MHNKYIDELLGGKVSLSPREHAAKNEILLLRKRLAEFEKGKNAKPARVKKESEK